MRVQKGAMSKKLTITVDDEVYAGLHNTVGRWRISRFLNDLARPHVMQRDLIEGYRAMAADEARARRVGVGREPGPEHCRRAPITRRNAARCGGWRSTPRSAARFARPGPPSSSDTDPSMRHRKEGAEASRSPLRRRRRFHSLRRLWLPLLRCDEQEARDDHGNRAGPIL